MTASHPLGRAPRRAAIVPRLVAPLATAALLGAGPAPAAINLDLDYVDQGSPAFATFQGWVDNAGSDVTPTDAIFLYRLLGQTGYATLAIDRVDDQVELAEAEIAAGRRPPISYDSYLHIGEMLRDLSLTLDWAGPLIDSHPGMTTRRARWSAYAEQAIYNLWHHETASWGGNPFPWSGWSVDNPGNNYHFSFLEASMLWALADNDAALVTFIDTVKLDPPLLDYYEQLAGGGSREGTGYGTAHMNLFWMYRIWRDGHAYDWGRALPHVADTIDYWLHATVPSFDRFAPIGDQSRVSYPELYDYQRRLVLEARMMVPGTPQAERASWWLNRISVQQMTSGFTLRHGLLPAGTVELAPTTRWHHATGVGHLFARTAWTPDALWMAMVAGPYEESHAHQDQGAITLFAGDEFLTVTENVLTHSGIQQGTDVHNVVRFEESDGTIVPQRNATSTMTATETAEGLAIGADLTPVYVGSNGLVTSWTRDVDFGWDGLVRVHDQFARAAGVRAIWQLNLPVPPQIAGRTATAGDLRVRVLAPADAVLTALDWTTIDPSEFLSGWRLDVEGSGGEYLVELDSLAASAIFADGFESGDASAWSATTP